MKTPGIELRLAGLRFTEADIEQQYRAWRHVEKLPLMRIAIVASMATWVSVTVVLYFWDHEKFALVLPYVAGLILPAFVLGTVLSFLPSARITVLPTVIALQILGGFAATCLVYWVGGSSGSAVAWGLVVALFAPFMHLPPWAAALAVAPYTVLLVVYAASAHGAGQLNSIDTFSYLFAPAVVLFVVVIVCAVGEHVSRRAFISDRTIREQRRMLERSQMLIRRYVPGPVAERIEAGDELAVDAPTRRRITVLFSDIVGFTDLADRVDAESLAQVVNEYMAAMADIVEEHGGTLNEFIGDGLMALFGAPAAMPPEEQACQAVAAAIAMQNRLPGLNTQWMKLGIGKALEIRIGVNTGVLSVGSFGSEGRMTYTAIGLQTNVAARIQSHCEPGGILISETTWHLARSAFECEPKGTLALKGVHYPVQVYQPKRAMANQPA